MLCVTTGERPALTMEKNMKIADFLALEANKSVTNFDRGYNGMSSIGEECVRKLQYNMHMASGEKQLSGRINRLFNVGHAFEDVVVTFLESAGFQLHGRQDNYVDENEMWFGHSDGFISHEGRSYLVEIKTHNDKSFKLMQKSGVKKAKPAHYDQMTMYMGYGEYEQGLYIAGNKNDSDLYFEEIAFDPKHFEKLKSKCVDVIASDALFPRIGNNSASWFECKFCDHIDVCFARAAPSQNCRTCKHSEAHNGNKWECHVNDSPVWLRTEEQKEGCDNHIYSEMFSS